MARTVPQLVALGVTMAFAIGGGSALSLSKGLGQAELGMELNGKKLFEKETFGGNGRTCRTCHSKLTGTLTLADVQRIIDKADPDDPFLIHDALDDDGVGTTRVQTHATIRYTIPLPPWLSMADDPGATHVTVFRGIPSTRNTPALDPVLLHDGRAPTLQEQALEAIHDHYQNTVEPTASAARCHCRIPANRRALLLLGCAQEVRRWLDRRLSCPLESRRPSSEDARSLSTRPSPLLPRTASAPSVMAVRC